MTSDRHVLVEFIDNRLALSAHGDGDDRWFSFPSSSGETTSLISLEEALHTPIRPTGTAERVLRAWSLGEPLAGTAEFEEQDEDALTGRRGASVVIRGGKMLVVRYPPEKGVQYFIPGGGVEEGESPQEAAVRELGEESGLTGSVLCELAVIYNRGREEHYYLVDAVGELGAPEDLDLYAGETLEWIDVDELADASIWPKRLAWRIAHWHEFGWPSRPNILADSLDGQMKGCIW